MLLAKRTGDAPSSKGAQIKTNHSQCNQSLYSTIWLKQFSSFNRYQYGCHTLPSRAGETWLDVQSMTILSLPEQQSGFVGNTLVYACLTNANNSYASRLSYSLSVQAFLTKFSPFSTASFSVGFTIFRSAECFATAMNNIYHNIQYVYERFVHLPAAAHSSIFVIEFPLSLCVLYLNTFFPFSSLPRLTTVRLRRARRMNPLRVRRLNTNTPTKHFPSTNNKQLMMVAVAMELMWRF